MKHILIISALMLVALAASPRQRTTKSVTPRPEPMEQAATPADTLYADTLESGKIVISGYDKQLRARQESFLITNNCPTTLLAVTLEIVYTDLAGRELHSTTRSVTCDIPPGSTRYHTIPAWDRQGAYYYRLSQPPRYSRGTPYDVKMKVISAIVEKQ